MGIIHKKRLPELYEWSYVRRASLRAHIGI